MQFSLYMQKLNCILMITYKALLEMNDIKDKHTWNIFYKLLALKE